MTESDDPAVIETVVVTATDLVTALEASHRTGGAETVLRMTPPFSGRMRARLHVRREPAAGDESPVELPAETLVEARCPPPPEPDDVEDELRADPSETYDVDRHRERYRAALEQWRSSIPDYVKAEAKLPATSDVITISLLGTGPEE